jgi:carbon-monoxide dehydrogenase iron sulfur subunit
MQRDLETGVVFIDQARCRGCFMCVMTCPFGCVVPASNYPVAQKCDLCLHREERACVEACPTDALIYADENEFAKVLAAKRGKVALFAQAAAPDHQLDLDYVQEGE